MRKLSLSLDDLRVESFVTLDEQDMRGTVRAHESEDYEEVSYGTACGCPQPTAANEPTCALTCGRTVCRNSCVWPTCGAEHTCFMASCYGSPPQHSGCL